MATDAQPKEFPIRAFHFILGNGSTEIPLDSYQIVLLTSPFIYRHS